MEAQEIIVTVWKEKQNMIDAGKQPERLILSPENYNKLRGYKEQLGELPNPEWDYLQKESLFGIPMYIDDSSTLTVE